uniref:inositol-phosphate phosphatase n=2 Tax=Caenorhabditis tropicalis TaxID=1561998 RepID=A0A1I7T736_9PELO
MEYQPLNPRMQVKIHPKNTFTIIMVVGFVYLAYLIFFESGDGMPEIDVNLKDVISYAVLAVEMGGHAVMKVDEEKNLNAAAKGLTDEGKEELLTRADLISNHLILDILQRFPQLKIVSEEKSSEFSDREIEPYRSDNYAVWQSVKEILDQIPNRRLQLSDVRVFVDPLDATQEFTEGLTEYVTVMACIVVDAEPIFGAIYRPFFNETVFGLQGFGVITSDGKKITPMDESKTAKKVVVSRSHAGKVKEVIEKVYGDKMTIEPAGGSGYKTLRLVNGTAELYLHTTAIKKWDTCAGDAILRTMGGAMLDLEGEPLRYSSADPILNKKGLLGTVRNPYTYFRKFQGIKLL